MKPRLLQITPLTWHVEDALEQSYRVERLFEMQDEAAFLAGSTGGIRAIATMGTANAALIDQLPDLEIISSFGVGYDGVDAVHAARRGVIVTNTPDVLNDDVANIALMMVLATSRRFVEWHNHARAGRWMSEGEPPLSRSIRGRSVGILGLGRIGATIAEKLEMLGMNIIYHGRRKQTGVAYRYYADLKAMAFDADFLIAICPGGEATRHMVNAQVLEALGPQGTFINIARGSVHDETALIEALQSGRLGAAGLDVFAGEPDIPEALRKLDNVVLQPHQGSATIETRRAMGDLVINNLAAHFASKPVLTPVS